jgi:hypothetical protein
LAVSPYGDIPAIFADTKNASGSDFSRWMKLYRRETEFFDFCNVSFSDGCIVVMIFAPVIELE